VVVATLVVDYVDVCRLDSLEQSKSFSPTTSRSVARGNLCCCTDVVVDVVVLEVAVLEAALVNLDAVDVLVADAANLDHISRVLGHSCDQSFRGAVCMSRTAFGC
jgi:hypothetical protein